MNKPATRKELILRGLMGSVALMDMDNRMKSLGRHICKLSKELKRVSRKNLNQSTSQLLLGSAAKGFAMTADCLNEFREMTETIQSIIKPKPEDIDPDHATKPPTKGSK